LISKTLAIAPENCLFLSDIVEELVAAREAGFQTIQLVRPGTVATWDHTVTSFNAISFE